MKVSPLTAVDLTQQIDLALLLHASSDEGAGVSEEGAIAPLAFNLPFDLLRHAKQSFVTYARDNDLYERGISEGDILLVDKVLKPQHQDVVVISLDGELQCRILDDKHGLLHCDADEPSAIVISEHADLMVEGVVIQAIKRLR